MVVGLCIDQYGIASYIVLLRMHSLNIRRKGRDRNKEEFRCHGNFKEDEVYST